MELADSSGAEGKHRLTPDGVRSPFRDGFAALWREPLLPAAELAWRWCFGFAAWTLAVISAALFLDSLILSRRDQFLLGTSQPVLLNRALTHVVQGSLLRFIWVQAILIVGLTLLWALAATAGRAATLRRVVDMFREDEDSAAVTWRFRPIFCLNLLRASWTLVALGAGAGSLTMGILMVHQQRAARAAFFLVFGIVLSCVFGFLLNWFFGLAPLFCVHDGVGASEAVARTLDFCAARGGRVLGLSLSFLLLRMVWTGTMFFCVLWPLSLAGHIALGWVMLLMMLAALVYFAGADLLYLARLGAYASLAEEEDATPPPEDQPGINVLTGPALPPDLAELDLA